MTRSSKIDDEINRLMRDSNALRSPSPYFDDSARFAQLGAGNPPVPSTQPGPFNGLFGRVTAGEHLNSQRGFNQTTRSNPHIPQLPVGPFVFAPTQTTSPENLPNGFRLTFTSPAYGYDPVTGAYVTIRATSASPVIIREVDGVVSIER
jgi:hypothetical protein